MMNKKIKLAIVFSCCVLGGTVVSRDLISYAETNITVKRVTPKKTQVTHEEDIEILSQEVDKMRTLNPTISDNEINDKLKEFIQNGGLDRVESRYGNGPKLTDAEINLIKLSPANVVQVYKAKEEAEYWTYQVYNRHGHNDNSDAFRHVVWNAFMVKRIGQREAKKWADAHEEYPANPYLEKRMDLHNNALGRSVSTNGSLSDIVFRVKHLIKNGKGLRIGVKKGRPALVNTDGRGMK